MTTRTHQPPRAQRPPRAQQEQDTQSGTDHQPVALITGASRGIGFACAQRLLADGFRVALTARKEAPLQDAARALEAPHRTLAIAGKADDEAHQAHAVDTVMREFGRIDVLVNNVGISPVVGPLIDVDARAFTKTVGVNVLAPLQWSARAVRAWMADNGGTIINMSSIAPRMATPQLGLYGSTKAMLDHLTLELAVELAPRIRVNGVAPGTVDTAFATFLDAKEQARMAAAYPMGRVGVPADIAGMVSFLASPDAAWITGQTYAVDGGVTVVGAQPAVDL